MDNTVTIVFSIVVIAGFLIGLRLMQSPKTALWGNRLGAACMVLAVLYTMYEFAILSAWIVWVMLVAGAVLGLILAQKVKMIQMPQTVALLNGLGGTASALVAVGALLSAGGNEAWFFVLTAAFAVAIGSLTFSGSAVAVLKLQGLVSPRPLVLPAHSIFLALILIVALAAVAGSLLFPGSLILLIAVSALLFALYGIIMALRVGGADMPIIIALLNSFSGIAAAICGLAVENLLLTGVGALVGVAGIILTQLMCRAMNRNLTAVLAGFKTAISVTAEHEETVETVETVPSDLSPEERIAGMLETSQKVVIVPGYGMALAQAQGQVKELSDALEGKGKEVKYAIHPVAGRMPGHMNVLLAEVGVPYEKLFDMEAINPELPETDLVVIVGACDVVNPAANSAEGTPIYGMPILEVFRSRNIIVCNLDEKPGYSGVENSLYAQSNVVGLWGDAAATVAELATAVRK